MAITGLGVDIEDISRFRETPFELNVSFYQKVFTGDEIKYCLSKVDPYQHFAVRFCAKEAFIKASSATVSNIKTIPNYKSIQTIFVNGKPFIEWNQQHHFVSFSHDNSKAVAVVIVE